MMHALHRLDLRRALARPSFYRLTQSLIRGRRSYHILAEQYLRIREGDRILDIGCGPAEILAHLPSVDYVGLDVSPRYLDAASRRFGSRGTFLRRILDDAAVSELGPASFDLVIAYGLVHHLDDAEARRFFETTHAALKPGGQLVTIDGCLVAGQSRIARYLLSKDRGRFVRSSDEYLALAAPTYSAVKADIRHDLLRFPYTLIVLECSR
jgi:SAM-dependent methyltransferase